MLSFENKIALVTGASGGIGGETAILLAKLGAEVYIHYNNSENQANEILKKIQMMDKKAHLIKCNISRIEEIKEMFSKVKKESGKLDILINNAGTWKSAYIKFLQESIWDDVFDVNLKGAAMCIKHSLNLLMKSKESIVINVASIAAQNTAIAQVVYNASKAGLISLTKNAARELAPFGIRVNAVSPGPVSTNMRVINESDQMELNKRIPMGRIAKPIDIANVIVLLCSPMANYITGQELVVDGGLTLI
jgi:3-oxoacyl-[acyl-carrier protein] reductase